MTATAKLDPLAAAISAPHAWLYRHIYNLHGNHSRWLLMPAFIRVSGVSVQALIHRGLLTSPEPGVWRAA